jgi:hypothetical protein
MPISYSYIGNALHRAVQTVDNHKKGVNALEVEKDLLTRLEKEIRKEQTGSSLSFNWEMDPDKRDLLDKIYDLKLLENLNEKVYAFTELEKVEELVNTLQVALKTKVHDLQNNQQIHAEKKQELMRFYNELLEIISKLAQIVSSVTQRI